MMKQQKALFQVLGMHPCRNFTYPWRRPASWALAPLRPASPRTWNWTLVQIAWSCLSQTRATTSSVCRVSCDRTRSCLRATAACYGARFPATPTGNLKGIRKTSLLKWSLWSEAVKVFQATSEQKLSEVSCPLFASFALMQAVLFLPKQYEIILLQKFNLNEKN